MYSYAAANLNTCADCSFSCYYLPFPIDRPFCCHHTYGQFSVSSPVLSDYLFGLSRPFPTKTLVHASRRRFRYFYWSRDFDMMGFSAEPRERFLGWTEPHWKKERRKIRIDLIKGEPRRWQKEGESGICSSRSYGSSSVRDSELFNEVGRKRACGESLVVYGNRKKGTKVNASEKEGLEVHKYFDDCWQERRNSSEIDVVPDSMHNESKKKKCCLSGLGVKFMDEEANQWSNLAQQVISRESGTDSRSKKVTRISEVRLNDELDDDKQTLVSANARKIKKAMSSASAARQSSDRDHRVVGHDQQRISLNKQNKLEDFLCNDVQSDAYPQRDFEETSVRYLVQNSAQISRDKRPHLHQRTLELDESRRSTQRLNEVSLFHDSESSDLESASRNGEKNGMGMDVISNLVQDSSNVSINKRSHKDTELYLSVEDRSEEKEENLTLEGNSIQFRGGERMQIHRGTVEHDETRRKAAMLSEVSEAHCGNMEAFSLSGQKRVMEFGCLLDMTVESKEPYFAQCSIPATKDKGTQVELHDACYDQIEMSKFNANNIDNTNPPVGRVDPQEHGTLLASNLVSRKIGQTDQANKQAYFLYGARMESQRDTSEFDLTRRNNIKNSNLQKAHKSIIENEKEFSSAVTSSLVLTQEEEIQRSSLTRESFQSASIETTSTGSLHGEFLGKLQKEVVSLNESGKTSNVSSGRRDVQATLRRVNRNEVSAETSSSLLTQERKERQYSQLMGESSQYKSIQIASTGSLGHVSGSVEVYGEVDNHSGGDDICHYTKDAIESAKGLDKNPAFHVAELADEMQQEIIMSQNGSGMKTGWKDIQATARIQEGDLTETRGYIDGRHIKEGGRLSSFGSGMRGPSEMWSAQILSSEETRNAEEPEINSPPSGTMDVTSTLETSITRKSPKSLWTYVADIIRMSWIIRKHSNSSTSKSNKGASSNESLSSEAWFSGQEADEDWVGHESQNKKQTALVRESGLAKESLKLPIKESKNEDSLTLIKPNPSISPDFMTSGLARTASSSVEAEYTHDSKSSQGILSNVVIVEQQLASKSDAELPSNADNVGSGVWNKVKVLKSSLSYPAAMMRVGFSSSITEAMGEEEIVAAQVREDNNSSLNNFEQFPAVSTIDSASPRNNDIEEVDRPGSIPKLELNPFRETLPKVGGTDAGIKQRKLQRNKQVLSEQFDEWEEAFKREKELVKLDEFFMREAILEAKKGSDAWEVPVGAVLVRNGKIIARCCNMVEELRDSTAHAEMICIREASNFLKTWRLAETTLYVTLEPCPMCAGAILQARIDTLVWGAPNRLLGADGSWVRLFPGGDGGSNSSMNPPSQMAGPVHPFHTKIAIRRGVLEKECGDVMQQFFKLRRKKDKKPESSPPHSYLSISNRPTKFFSKLHNIFCMMFCL